MQTHYASGSLRGQAVSFGPNLGWNTIDNNNQVISYAGSVTTIQMTLSLELDTFRLQVLLKSQGGDYVKVIERSQGLRQFLALLLFLSKRPATSTRGLVRFLTRANNRPIFG